MCRVGQLLRVLLLFLAFVGCPVRQNDVRMEGILRKGCSYGSSPVLGSLECPNYSPTIERALATCADFRRDFSQFRERSGIKAIHRKLDFAR